MGHVLAFLLPSMWLAAQEVCNNGIDDDTDGLIDLNDPDCPCATVVIGDGAESYIRNHSFEDRLCCPQGFVAPPYTPPWLSCATGWHQATSATSDYFHECAYSPAGFNLPPPDGEGAVGFFAAPGYFEYVGTCLTYPAPAHPLLAGNTYTLSLWITCGGGNGQHSQNAEQADPSVFTEQFPLAIFGHANSCVEFPMPISDCVGFEPGWNELGRVMVQPAWAWTRVYITFTPTQDIHSVMIGGACDVPASYGVDVSVVDSQGNTTTVSPYFIIDDLTLTLAGDQMLSAVGTSGTLCLNTATATGTPPSTATGHQWYLDGVAVTGQTGLGLNVSQLGLGGGMYTLASQVNGECLMASSYIPPALDPVPTPMLEPTSGCAPLSVAFADTTGGGETVQWLLGDGTVLTDSSFTHTYTVPGSYDVQLTVRNSAGCTADTLLVDAVTVHALPGGTITATPNPVELEDPQVLLTGGASGDIVSWWWDLGAGDPSTSTSASVSATFPAVAGEYPVMLVVSTTAGCRDTVRSVVVVYEPGVVEMPNVFSPNGDGHNDRFVPLEYNGTAALLEVFNRWGQLLFSTRSLAQGWSGNDVPAGTYFYVVTPDDASVERHSGHVTLVR